jgi:hypothetical protein
MIKGLQRNVRLILSKQRKAATRLIGPCKVQGMVEVPEDNCEVSAP